MSRSLFYLGADPAHRQCFEGMFDGKIEYTADVADAQREIEKRSGRGEGVILLFERDRLKSDTVNISYLRKKFPDMYIALLSSDVLEAAQRKAYHKSGVNDVMACAMGKDAFLERIEFIGKYQKRLLKSSGGGKMVGSMQVPVWKRSFDIVFSTVLLLVISPLLLAAALAIRLESKGPIVYKSKRVGSYYKIFDFLKFRSMYADADKRLKEFKDRNQYGGNTDESATGSEGTSGPLLVGDDTEVMLVSDDQMVAESDYIQKKEVEQENAFVKFENDPRVTRVGRFIRKYSIDELPQLLNVLKGDMSVVGNRPLPLYEAEKLTSDDYIDRFMAPAGLTGLWQVEKRGGAGKMSAEERKMFDIEYARHYSLRMDMWILFRTLTAFVQKENV